MLARDGHQVTVLEVDPADAPGSPSEAWQSWERKGVAQFRQPHLLFPPVPAGPQPITGRRPVVESAIAMAGPSVPAHLGSLLVAYGTISVITSECDNDSWSVVIVGANGDVPLKARGGVLCRSASTPR